MKKSNTVHRILLLMMICIVSFFGIGQTVLALDNTTTVGSQTTDTIDAFYYSDQYFWKVSLFVAKADTVNKESATIDDFYRIGDEAVYLSPVSGWAGWAGGSRPNNINSLLFSADNKIDTLSELASKGDNTSALDPVNLTNASGVDIVQNVSNLPYPPQMCDGYLYNNSVSYSEYTSSLSDVTNYFSDNIVITGLLNHYASEFGKSSSELVSELEFTINGETRTGWNPEGILPKVINSVDPNGTETTNSTNQVEWLVVYEPCTIVYTRDASWTESHEVYNGYVMSATDFAVSQLTKQMDWRYDESRMSGWAGLQPDAWLPNAQRQHVARLSHLVVGDSVLIKDTWYGFASGNGVDANAAVPYNRWTSEAELSYGGWGMSMWERPMAYTDAVDYDYNENTDVIYSAQIFTNTTTSAGSDITVTYEINGESYTDTVVGWAGSESISYFKWHTPDVDTATSYDLKITVSPYPDATVGADGNEYVHKTITVYPLEESTPPDPKVDDELPSDFNTDVENNIPESNVADDSINDTDAPAVKSVVEVSEAPYYYNDIVTLNVITNRNTDSITFQNIDTGEIRLLTDNSIGNGILVSTFENQLNDTITWEIQFALANFGRNTYSITPSSASNGSGETSVYALDLSVDPDIPVINDVSISPDPDPNLGFYYLFADTQSPDLEYTLYFDTDGGTEMDTQKVKANTLLEIPDQPVKIGFLFAGWYKDNNYTEMWDFDSDRIRGTTTLYAKWTIQTFNVSFNNNGKGSTVPAQTVEYGQNVIAPEWLVENGSVFEGWFTDSAFTNAFDFDNDVVTNDLTLYAKWTPEKCLVGFEENGGKLVEDQLLDYLSLVSEPITERAGYTLLGWFTDSSFTNAWNFSIDRVTENMVLYAKWQANPSVISFEENGGSETPDLVGVTDQVVSDRNMPVITRDGYTQKGWFKEADFSGEEVTELPEKFPVDGVTYYAKWEANPSVISFEENGGSDTPDLNGVTDQEITDRTMPVITRDGYTQKGWFKEADFSGEEVAELPEQFPVDGVTYYAKWEANPSVISFEENGGSETPDLNGFTDQEITDRTMPVLSRVGYTQKGWFKEADFSGEEVTELPEKFPVDGVTYYAKWEINVYSVIFDTADGSSIDNQAIEYLQKASRPETDPVKDGFYFKNWYKDEALTEIYDFDTPITGDITIYARWLGPDDGLDEFTPEQIGDIAENGEGDDFFDIGDEVTIELSTGEQVVMQIYGFDHDFKSDSGKTDITFGTKDLLLASDLMNTSADNGDGWDSSALRSWMRTTLYDELPAEWQALIYNVDKETSSGGLAPEITVSSDAVYAFSEKELIGASSQSLSGEGRQYPIFESGTVIKNQNGSATNYWTRSATPESESAFTSVGLDGAIGSNDADSELGVAFGFSIGTSKQYTVTFDATGANETVDDQIIDANSLATDPDIALSRDDDYFFDKWYKDAGCTEEFNFYNDYITADTILYAGWIEMPPMGSPLEDFTWEQIGIIADQGLGEDYWAVGDEKTDTLSTGEELTFQIYGFNHDPKSDGTSDTNITFGLKKLMADAHYMNPSLTNYQGWNGTDMRAYLNGVTTTYQTKDYGESSVYSKLPSDVKAIVSLVDKYASGGYGTTPLVKSSDYLFLFSEEEAGTLNNFGSTSGEGTAYPIFTNDTSRIKYNTAGAASKWWLRSSYNSGNTMFLDVLTGGSVNNDNASNLNYINFGFSVGTSPYSTITYNSQGGTTVSSVEVENGTTFLAPTAPTKTNYVFGGWFKDAACTESFDFATDTVDQNTTLYAKWQAEVTFDSQGGSAVASQIVDVGGYASQPGSPSRDGYTFVGWFDNLTLSDGHVFESEKINQNTTLYAKWDLGVPDADVPLDNWSWDQIEKVANLGLAEDYFVVGEEKTIVVNGVSFIFQIYDFNHDELADDSGNLTNITFGTKNAMNNTGQIMDSGTNNGWEYSDLRAWMNSTLISQFPSEVSNIMKQVYKGEYSGADNGNCIVASSDYLFVPSAMEFRGDSPGGTFYYTGGSKYPIFDDPDNYIKHPGDYAPSSFTWYWSRSSSYYGKYMAYFQNYSSSTTGSWDPNWNFAVVPCFCIGNAPTNTYSVTYNSNGGSAVSTQTVTLNNKATEPTDPTMTNAIFDGWYTDAGLTSAFDFNTAITANTTLYAKWITPGGTLESYSWDQISAISEAGMADVFFNVGDTKIVTINGMTTTFAIYDFNHDTKVSGGKAGITFGTVGNLQFNEEITKWGGGNMGGWPKSNMRAYLNGFTTANQRKDWTWSSVYYNLPSDLKSQIKLVYKQSSGGYDSPALVNTQDYLFAFSEEEIYGSNMSCSQSGEGTIYPIFTTNASRLRYNTAGTAVTYATRSAYVTQTDYYYGVSYNGGANTNISTGSAYISLGFCI